MCTVSGVCTAPQVHGHWWQCLSQLALQPGLLNPSACLQCRWVFLLLGGMWLPTLVLILSRPSQRNVMLACQREGSREYPNPPQVVPETLHRHCSASCLSFSSALSCSYIPEKPEQTSERHYGQCGSSPGHCQPMPARGSSLLLEYHPSVPSLWHLLTATLPVSYIARRLHFVHKVFIPLPFPGSSLAGDAGCLE